MRELPLAGCGGSPRQLDLEYTFLRDVRWYRAGVFQHARPVGDAFRPGRYGIMFHAARTSLLRQARAAVRPACVQQSSLARLLSTLAVLETRDGKLNIGSLAAVTAGQKLGGSVTGFLAGSNIKAVAAEAAKVDGLEKVIYVENEAYSKGLPENYAPLLVENIKKGGFTHIVSGHSSFGKSLMPRLAAMMDVQQISDITSVDSEDSKSASNLTYP